MIGSESEIVNSHKVKIAGVASAGLVIVRISQEISEFNRTTVSQKPV